MKRGCMGRGATWVAAALVLAGLSAVQALDLTGKVPLDVWRQVLQTEPNQHVQELAEFTETPGVLQRTFFSDAHRAAAQQLAVWMREAGMDAWIDVLGNVHGSVNGTDPGAPAVVIGSHYDTVVDAGKYDGTLGVLLGIAAVKALVLEGLSRKGLLGEAGLTQRAEGAPVVVPAAMAARALPSPVLVVAFADEEGIRFKSTFLGSRALAGTFLRHKQLHSRDASGMSIGQLLALTGLPDPAGAVAELALKPRAVKHYVEFHVEQGPVLAAQGVPLGVVAGIAGQTWLSVSVEGDQGHAGTVPMEMRRDPMAAAAELISMVEATCTGRAVLGPDGVPEETDHAPTQALRCTVGSLALHPGQTNSIPRWANFSADVRCRSDGFRAATLDTLHRRLREICTRRNVSCTVTQTHDAQAVHSDPSVMAQLRRAVVAAQPLFDVLLPLGGDDGPPPPPPPIVTVDNDADPNHTVIRVSGQGRPGLLAALTTALSDHGLDVVRAEVGGSAGRVEDSFHVVLDEGGGKLVDAAGQEALAAAMRAVLADGASAGTGGGGGGGAATAEGAMCGGGGGGGGGCVRPGARSAVGQAEVPELLSGAGHDAMAMADLTRIGMMFVRSLNGGVSHSPLEYTAPEDVTAAAAALATFLELDLLDGGGGGDTDVGAAAAGHVHFPTSEQLAARGVDVEASGDATSGRDEL